MVLELSSAKGPKESVQLDTIDLTHVRDGDLVEVEVNPAVLAEAVRKLKSNLVDR